MLINVDVNLRIIIDKVSVGEPVNDRHQTETEQILRVIVDAADVSRMPRPEGPGGRGRMEALAPGEFLDGRES